MSSPEARHDRSGVTAVDQIKYLQVGERNHCSMVCNVGQTDGRPPIDR
ncbi:hypothetical protein HSR121_0750 [Halapricum desulfuricans]|uniref:Uncharacterized protein n=1 Tax=Halapricum desulfuricans TaxID=2841257 RepID=A0A897MXC9_9EURY|nr:hypothetical protein HSR121_0750 [Halapricum desulfuricans]